tara:strand:+ start:15778 stop:16701 length:924 start_codon:yes stop_codon:yes gene_type:complete
MASNIFSDSSSSDSEYDISSAETEIQEEKMDIAATDVSGNQVTEEKVEDLATEEKKEPEEEIKCTVCYTELNIKNIVNTQCNHKYCWECFFKWIKTNPTCPYCRCNFMSEDAWYENRDVNHDIDNLRSMANILQLELVKASTRLNCIERRKRVLKKRVKVLRRERELNLKSLISANAQIEYMRGYHSALRGDKKDSEFVHRNNRSHWFRGFTMGIYEIQEERYNIDYNKFNCFAKSILNENEIKKFKKIIKVNRTNYIPCSDSENDDVDNTDNNQMSLENVIISRIQTIREFEQANGETKQSTTVVL